MKLLKFKDLFKLNISGVSELKSIRIFDGTFEEFLKLSDSEQDKIFEMYQKYLNDKHEKLLKENNSLKMNTNLNLNNINKNKVLLKIEEIFNKMKVCNENYEFILLKQQYENSIIELEKLKHSWVDLIDLAKKNNISISNNNLLFIDTNISIPKFGFFSNRKYKLLDSLLNDEYIYKLKTRQIDSDFVSNDDYNDKVKWKEFIDKKEREYQMLHNKTPQIYSGTFEEFLQEDAVVIFEYLKFGHSLTKIRQKQAEQAKMHQVMYSQDAQELALYAVDSIQAVLGPSGRRHK